MDALTDVIILAGGKGLRFGATKQFVKFNEIPLFIYTLQKFNGYRKILTIPLKYRKQIIQIIKKYKINNISVITGGNTRQKSVFNALEFINKYHFKKGNVIITDANRPFITLGSIIKCKKELNKYHGVITSCKTTNTICQILENKLNKIYIRDFMYDLLMPQCFNFKRLFIAHKLTNIKNATDDTQILRNIFPTSVISNVNINFWEGIKLTHPNDYEIFDMLLRRKQ